MNNVFTEVEEKSGISFFEKYLTVWVLLCMAAGMLIGKFLPGVADHLESYQVLNTNIPIAVLTWVMIFPMMMKIDFKSILNVRKTYQGIVISSITSWLIKPFLMFGLATFFFYVVFSNFIPAEIGRAHV